MKTSTDTSLNILTGASSVSMFIVGLVKSVDWVMVASVLLPMVVGLINLGVKRQEVKRQKENARHEQVIHEMEEKFSREKHEQEMELMRVTAARKVELEAEINARTVDVLRDRNRILTEILDEVKTVTEEEKKYLLNKLMEQVK